MMSYFMEEVYRGSNPGYGSGDLIIATYGAHGDRYAYGTYHEVMEDPENLPTGHRGFKEEVMASMRAELESAEAYEPCGVISSIRCSVRATASAPKPCARRWSSWRPVSGLYEAQAKPANGLQMGK